MVWANYKKYVREFGATLSIEDFSALLFARQTDTKIKIPRSMATPFAEPSNPVEGKIKAAIDTFEAAETTRLEQELFKQRKRLADA